MCINARTAERHNTDWDRCFSCGLTDHTFHQKNLLLYFGSHGVSRQFGHVSPQFCFAFVLWQSRCFPSVRSCFPSVLFCFCTLAVTVFPVSSVIFPLSFVLLLSRRFQGNGGWGKMAVSVTPFRALAWGWGVVGRSGREEKTNTTDNLQ